MLFFLQPAWVLIAFLTFPNQNQIPEIYLKPILHVNFGDPTADKPQSKSWVHDDYTWLVVAGEKGPELWKRDKTWQSQTLVNTTWKGQPNKADVYSSQNDAYVLLVEECLLKVAHLEYSKKSKQYNYKAISNLPIPKECHSIETATITRDSQNRFWVASDWNEKIVVWHSTDGISWSEPITLAEDIDADDISLVVSLKNKTSVIWSNQKTESIMERTHDDRQSPELWSKPIIVQQGDSNADDHLNATVFDDNSMALVTKNSLDKINEPQFVFRYRTPSGQWTNIPYENLPEKQQPSRPIINHVKGGKIYTIHAVKDRTNSEYFISVKEVIHQKEAWEFKELIRLRTHSKGKNGDVTSSKAPFTKSSPQLIFFSDDLGNVFEFDLKTLEG